ncbi:MAG TPA: phosphate signaling complex protein PhoU [Aggregatilineaceae bacterium]|nr:phosphate signaling complex protein PhoU [Aggregatilineaceae bacterium]
MTDAQNRPRSPLDRELTVLRDGVLKLSYAVDQSIESSVRALKERNVELARQVIADDENINAARFDLEKECYRLLATQQPTARDMRSIVTAIHIIVELERIGDHARGIAKLGIELAKEHSLKPLIDIPRMEQICREMLRASLNAYLNWDAAEAKRTIGRDDEVDQLDDQVYRELLTFMLNDPRTINRATYLLWVSHNMERIADRITNICERVVFMVTGEVGEAADDPDPLPPGH